LISKTPSHAPRLPGADRENVRRTFYADSGQKTRRAFNDRRPCSKTDQQQAKRKAAFLKAAKTARQPEHPRHESSQAAGVSVEPTVAQRWRPSCLRPCRSEPRPSERWQLQETARLHHAQRRGSCVAARGARAAAHAAPAAMASVRQELAARELAAPGSRVRSGCEASRNRKNFPVIYSSSVRWSSRSIT
jgi:hypothetical protein